MTDMTTNNRPRLCRDVFESNANTLVADLRKRLGRAQSVRSTATSGGDFEHTITAFVRTLHAAIDAAEKQARLEMERDNQ